jgi:PhzF family phenazine biosynthesis protein
LRPDLAQIDAFTDAPFQGNPAGVCFLDLEPDEEWMQSLAAEMNLSETAFLFPPAPDEVTESEPPTWRLRWFTPVVEVALCGHATLASAHYLFTQRKIDAPLIRFLTKSGLLTASRTPDDFIELDFPADDPTPAPAPAGLLAGLGLRDEMVVATAKGRTDILVEVADATVVAGLQPDAAALRRLDVRGVIVTSVGTGLYDIVSRFFAPGAGIGEDPVTGSAHTTLGPYWAPKLGKDEMLAQQVSTRTGVVRVLVAGDRVHLAGQAVTVFRARLDDAVLPRRKRARRANRNVPTAASN